MCSKTEPSRRVEVIQARRSCLSGAGRVCQRKRRIAGAEGSAERKAKEASQ